MPTPICETPSVSSRNHGQFEATRKWRKAIKIFHKCMPLSTHRRQLRTYTETFTGKDALDLAEQIFPSVFPLCTSRDKSRQLLERFLCCGYITNVRDENCKNFSDNATLYKFCNERMAQILNQEDEMNRKQSILLPRSSSMREGDVAVRMDRLATKEFMSTKTKNMMEDLSKVAKINGRLSISCQEISTIEGKSNSSQTKKQGTSILNNLVNIGKASASLFSLNRSNSDSARSRRQKFGDISVTNSKSFYDSRIALNNNKISGTSQSVFNTNSSTTAHLLPKHRYRAPMLNRSHTVDQTQSVRNFVLNEGVTRPLGLVEAHKQKMITTGNDGFLPINWYCDRIDKNEYEAQSKDADRHLLDLLDQILSNRNLGQLRKFRLAYPSIYEKRFPTRTSRLVVTTHINQPS